MKYTLTIDEAIEQLQKAKEQIGGNNILILRLPLIGLWTNVTGLSVVSADDDDPDNKWVDVKVRMYAERDHPVETLLEKYALIFCGFDCDMCYDYECHDPNNSDLTAKAAKEKGWISVIEGDKWIALCPKCKGILKQENGFP